jgi:Tfp pilus assembly PilM family ATPase
VILTGGSSNMPGLKEYLSRGLGVEVIIGNPFSRVRFDQSLESVLRKDLNSTLAVSVGLAMRDF